jgi:hypothetical protein
MEWLTLSTPLDQRTPQPQAANMDPADKQRKQVRFASASAAASRTASTAGRTPLERIRDALELGRRGRMLQQLARHDGTSLPRAR